MEKPENFLSIKGSLAVKGITTVMYNWKSVVCPCQSVDAICEIRQ